MLRKATKPLVVVGICGERGAHMQCEDSPLMERAHPPRPFGCGLRVTVMQPSTRQAR